MSIKMIAEYVWVDSENNIRSKNRILTDYTYLTEPQLYPKWSFDGSSTSGTTSKNNKSDVYLTPVAVYPNPFFTLKTNDSIISTIVLCTTSDNESEYNTCNEICKKYESYVPLVGVEQEYMILDLYNSNRGYEWMTETNPRYGHQDVSRAYYCSVGGGRSFGREMVDEHLRLCLLAGVSICGTNSEVVASQWEYQLGVCDPMTICNDLIVSRYILLRLSETYNCTISFHPKPIEGWNGSGCHVNFSTKYTRSKPDGMTAIMDACESLAKKHTEHMGVYGEHNNMRLCAKYETSSFDHFTYGVADRNASVRIPQHVADMGAGYLEDRRPAANINPYLVIGKIVETVCIDGTNRIVSDTDNYRFYD
jgi:glutamine synthetase